MRTCETCEWFVLDKDGEYSHEKAKLNGSGFCIMEELFVNVEASFPSCRDYQEESKEE